MLTLTPTPVALNRDPADCTLNGSSRKPSSSHFDYAHSLKTKENTTAWIRDRTPKYNLSASTYASQDLIKMGSEAAHADQGSFIHNNSDFDVRKFQSDSVESGFSMNLPVQKTDDQIRSDYIGRLKHMKLMNNEHHKPHQTLTIFDWDDTVLPTSYLCHIGFESVNPEVQRKLQNLDKNASKLMAKATRAGKICIVTNAMESWVETSAQKFLPQTYRTICENKILIISARAEYEDMFPDDPRAWKMETFLDLADNFERQIPTNIICLGDNQNEIEASIAMGKRFERAMVKTLKFKERPRPEELTRQLELLLQKFDQIYTTLKTLNITLEKKSP